MNWEAFLLFFSYGGENVLCGGHTGGQERWAEWQLSNATAGSWDMEGSPISSSAFNFEKLLSVTVFSHVLLRVTICF